MILLALAMPPPLNAANFYKHVDTNGVVTYGNQPPGDALAQTAQQEHSTGAAHQRDLEQPGSAPKVQSQRLQARLQQDIAQRILQKELPVASTERVHNYRYARPWKEDRHAISQGVNGSFSHNTPQSRYAVDIAMPEGTAIYAARSGTVVKVKNDQSGKSSNPNGNYLRILHHDGTSSAYLHLQHGSIVVKAGQRVEKGRHVASSGNTGRSTGPHLHFVVQRYVSNRFESIPFRFDNPPSHLPNFAANSE